MDYFICKDEVNQLETICINYGVTWCQATKDYKQLARSYMKNVFGEIKKELETMDYTVVISNLKEKYKIKK